jgi:glyoxylase-like metal-dependent hydrolase (beta-lactamase superfamily II)
LFALGSKKNNMNRALVDKREVSATAEQEILNNVFAVAPGVWRMKDVFVNIYLIQDRTSSRFVLVDTGLKSGAPKIKRMIAEAIEPGGVPTCIIMTHGHFDHRGSLQELADEWNIPIYCHHMEAPYLTGRAPYPPADPSVGGGMMSTLSFVYPKKPIDVSDHLRELPDDGSVPELPEWNWIHTPGHTPGHISLFRERDGVLIAGDAFVTTNQHSVFSVMTQKKEICGPPAYFTPDWGAAARSVRELAALEPNVISTGHGHAMYGDEARKALHRLSRSFWKLGMPEKGRYVTEPALFNEDGPTYVPPTRPNYTAIRIVAAAALVIAGIILYKQKKKSIGRTLLSTAIPVLTARIPRL